MFQKGVIVRKLVNLFLSEPATMGRQTDVSIRHLIFFPIFSHYTTRLLTNTHRNMDGWRLLRLEKLKKRKEGTKEEWRNFMQQNEEEQGKR